MNKNQALELINKKEGKIALTAKNVHWANLSLYGDNEGWWLNVPFDKFSENLYFILNNEHSSQFILVSIQGGIINEPLLMFRDKEGTADIFIAAVNSEKLGSSDALIDIQSNGSKHNFAIHQIEIIEYTSSQNNAEHLYPEEVPETLKEGSKKTIIVNSYERNPKARLECIKKYGVSCVVCGFNFKETYGERGRGFIHVHHLVAVSNIGDEYTIDPIRDLRPVCPNCHAMLHRKGNISIEELIDEIKSNKKSS
jgi:predicted HNH restriction endonuclease